MLVLVRSRLGVAWLLVAVMTGIITPGYPLALLAGGLSKPQIAVFFAINSLSAFTFSILSVRFLSLISRRYVLPALLLAAAAGMVLLVEAGTSPFTYVGGVLSMLFVAAMPALVRTFQATGRAASADDAALSARIRSISVLGYVLGVGAFGLAAQAAVWMRGFDPVQLAAACLVAAALLLLRANAAPASAPAKTQPDQEAADSAPGLRTGRLLLGLVVVGLVLLKGADSLRLVYLPIFVVVLKQPEYWVSVLFILTAVVELLVLRVLASRVPAHQARAALTVAAGCAAVSFAISGIWGSLAAILVSQLIYALFAATFQAFGPVLLGRFLTTGLSGGTGIFGGILQAGALIGVLSPLAVAGYRKEIFWLAFAFCVVSATVLLMVGRMRQKTVAGEPVSN